MAQIVIRETVQVPATPPVRWTREINMPPQSWFRGEWLPAKLQREAQIEKVKSDFRKWMRFIAWLLTGIGFCGSVLVAYVGMIALVGTP